MQLFDLTKHKLLKKLQEEAEKTAGYLELLEIAAEKSGYFPSMQINRAVMRYYALQRRIEKLKYDTNEGSY